MTPAEARAKAASRGGWGRVADAHADPRYALAMDSKRRNRGECGCGCGRKTTHVGVANGMGMTSGCEWSIRQWVRNPDWDMWVPHRIRVTLPDHPPGWLADPPRGDDGAWLVVTDVALAGEWTGREAFGLDIALNRTRIGPRRKAVRARSERVLPASPPELHPSN